MHPLIAKSFGGLTAKYYCRQLFFGACLSLIIFLPFLVLGMKDPKVPTQAKILLLIWLIASVLLYPYSRFIYKSVVNFIKDCIIRFKDFIVGDTVSVMGDMYFRGAIIIMMNLLMLFIKLMTMYMCFIFSLFIAPIGLIYIYFKNR